MKIYISGQITGVTEKEYTENFDDARRAIYLNIDKEVHNIEGVYYDAIINPLEIKPLFGIKKWLWFMISDIKELNKCTHIAMQKNWIESRGAIIEYYFAKFIFKLKIIWL